MQDLFTNTFPLDGKIRLLVAGVSENRKKKWFPLARKQFPLAGIRLFLKKWISTSRKKVEIKKYFFK